jgi:predicted metal-binding protein
MRRIVICTTCKFSETAKFAPDGRTGGEMMLAAMQGLLAKLGRVDLVAEPQTCLWNCTRPCSVVMQDSERFSYVTGGNTPDEAQAEALLTWFDLHGETADGSVPFKQWPQKMRGHFIARIPPLKSEVKS